MINNYLLLIKNFYCNSIIPQLYDNGLSYNEQISKIIKKINEIITRVNDLNEFVNVVYELVKELDAHIAEIVKEQLTTWLNDGTLEEILQNVSNEFFNQLKTELLSITIKTPRIMATRVFREIRNLGDYNILLETNKPYYSWLQGFTAYTDGNGMLRFALAFISQNTNYTKNNTVDLAIFDENGNILRHSTFILGHAQSICYLNGQLYVSFSYEFQNGNQVNTNKVAIIDEGTLTSYNVVTFDRMVHELCTDGENIYCSSIDNASIYKMDFENKTTTLLFYNQDIKTTIQGMCIYKDKFFIATSAQAKIVVCDKSGNTFYVYSFPRETDNLYNVGEIQGLSVINDTFYFGTFSKMGQPSNSQLLNNQVFKFNLYTNNDITSTSILRGNDVKILYVDNTANSRNPNGDETNPFMYVQEALESATHCIEGAIEIHLKGDDFHSATIRTNKTINFVGDNPISDRSIIGGVYIQLAPFVRLSNLEIRQTNTFHTNAPLEIVEAVATTHGLRFKPTLSNYVQCNYGCQCIASYLLIDNLNDYQNNADFNTETGKQQYTANASYITPQNNLST